MKFKESETVELKTSTAQLSRALETLCAFANTNLGRVGLCFVVILKRKEGTKHPAGAPQVPRKLPASAPQVIYILEFCMSPQKREDIQKHLGLKDREYFRKALLIPFVKEGLLALTIPDKPSSPKQQYITTEEGKELLKDTKERT